MKNNNGIKEQVKNSNNICKIDKKNNKKDIS